MGEEGLKKEVKMNTLWVMYFLYKKKNRIFKPVKITIRRELR
jgi:hypothetical protein